MRRDPQILIARYADLEVRDIEMPRMGSMGGRWRVEKFKACGRDGLGEVPGTRRVVHDHPNLLTDKGLNLRGEGPLSFGCRIHCGSGTATPVVADTSLANWVAAQQVEQAGFPHVFWTASSAPYFASHQRKARFAANFAGGAVNITELGIGPTASNEDLHSRVLTLDGGGSPAAVPIDADEAFDAYYTLENYPDHLDEDGTGSVDISGTVYDFTIRPAFVTTPAEWSRNIYNLHSGNYSLGGGTQGNFKVYGSDAALGAVTSEPSATSTATVSSTSPGITDGTYTTDTFQRKITYNWSLTQGNVTGGIKAMALGSTWGKYQLLFDNPIPKTGSNTLAFPLTTVWSRHV